jgi:hypothetical protein
MTKYAYVRCHKKKTGKQFVDFLKRLEKKIYDKRISKISFFCTCDNLSVHKSKKVKGEISKSVAQE